MFSEQKEVKQIFSTDDEKQLITGVAISVNQPIYRKDQSGEYWMVFDKATTRELGRRMMQRGYGGNVNINHNHDEIIKSARIDQVFYIDKEEGIEAPKDFKGQNLQDGTMFVTYHIEDKKEFELLKSRDLKGFSIEVYVDTEKTNFSKQINKSNINMSKKEKGLFELIKGYFDNSEEQAQEFAEVTTVDGVNLKWEGELTPEETVIYITAEGEEDMLATEGLHTISEGEKMIVLTVNADGVLQAMEEVEEENEEMSEVEQTVELMAKQIVKIQKEKDSLKSTINEFSTRFENIEAKLDGNKKESKKAFSVAEMIKRNSK